MEKQRRKKSPHENPRFFSGKSGANVRHPALGFSLDFSRFILEFSEFDEEAKFREFFRNVPEESAGSSWKKTIRKDSRGEERERRGRLLNEINEKQRSAGGFNPL